MRRIGPNVLCLVGAASASYAMWQVHSALMYFVLGVLSISAGVVLYREQNASIKGQAK